MSRLEEPADFRRGEDRFASLAKQSKAYVAQHFGPDLKWAGINEAIWSAIATRNDHALTLTDVDRVAKNASAEGNKVLPVLTLLSRPGAELLNLDYLGMAAMQLFKLSREELGKKVKAWWKDKTMSDDEWRSWAGNVVVKWSLIDSRDGAK
jgi:hypothetical protein